MADNDTWTKDVPVPTMTVIGMLGDKKVVRADWKTGKPSEITDRMLANLADLGIVINDDPTKYLF